RAAGQARAPVGHGVPAGRAAAGDREAGPASLLRRRQAVRPDRRHPGRRVQGPGRAARRGDRPEVRREPARLPVVRRAGRAAAGRRQGRGGRAARQELQGRRPAAQGRRGRPRAARRQQAGGRAGDLAAGPQDDRPRALRRADRVRPGRQTIHHVRRAAAVRAGPGPEHEPRRDRPDQPGRVDPAGQPVREQAGHAAGRVHDRQPQPARGRHPPGLWQAVGERDGGQGRRRAERDRAGQELRLAGRRGREQALQRRPDPAARREQGVRPSAEALDAGDLAVRDDLLQRVDVPGLAGPRAERRAVVQGADPGGRRRRQGHRRGEDRHGPADPRRDRGPGRRDPRADRRGQGRAGSPDARREGRAV
ncbi:MAG: PQQ-dependent oxidoreductase, gdhB family, partial [uncultured Phycisphaerae bacterium]